MSDVENQNSNNGARRCVFLDRDGVINEKAPEGKYIMSWEEFRFLPGVRDAIKRINDANYLTVIITNQRGIARQLMTIEALKDIHERMIEELRASRASIDGIQFCPHDKFERCGCRKPEPGMLLNAARELNIDLSRSWMVGDKESDILAGRGAGCRTLLVGDAPFKDPADPRETTADYRAPDLPAAVELILSMNER